MSDKFIIFKPDNQPDRIFKAVLWVSIIIAVIVVGYILERRVSVHVKISRISSRFSKISNKNYQYLYAKRKRLDPSFEERNIVPASRIKIDVVIPVIAKDLETAHYTIESIKKLVNHKIGKIYLVAPDQKPLRNFASAHGCEFIDEDKVLPGSGFKKYGESTIQQLIKLNADAFVEQDHYLVVDADTVFLRPVVFDRNEAYLVNVNYNCCKCRKKYAAKILANPKAYRYDFVAHHMLFSKKILREMKQHIATTYKSSWDQALLKMFNSEECMVKYFSDYELYATYLTEFSDAQYRFVSNANIVVHRNLLKNLDSIIPAYAGDYKTLSMHHFILF